ncbi:rhomboid family intramembrane serine protease [Cytophagaceae bacterium ABcell3]|nr:rhomboid family intramembrane serine protease [Cytophagaceae bacterium ABcell3]
MLEEKKRLFKSLIPGTLIVAIAALVYLLDRELSLNFYKLGIYPRNIKGLPGLITSPFIHSSTSHLYSNAIPIILLTTAIRFFYYDIFYKILFLIWAITNLWIWCLARESFHIGASGLLYGFAFFLFFGGIFRKDRPSIALSLLIAFLYGSLFWGLFPFNMHISWEAHLMGALSGLLVAWHFRSWNLPIKEPEYEWMNEDHDKEEEYPYWLEGTDQEVKEKKDGEDKPSPPDQSHTSENKTLNFQYVYVSKKEQKKTR